MSGWKKWANCLNELSMATRPAGPRVLDPQGTDKIPVVVTVKSSDTPGGPLVPSYTDRSWKIEGFDLSW
jgi:hypothetical protein